MIYERHKNKKMESVALIAAHTKFFYSFRKHNREPIM